MADEKTMEERVTELETQVAELTRLIHDASHIAGKASIGMARHAV